MNYLATLLDPHLKTLRFQNPTNCDAAVKQLKAECAALMRSNQSTEPSTSSAPPQSGPAPASTGKNKLHAVLTSLNIFCMLMFNFLQVLTSWQWRRGNQKIQKCNSWCSSGGPELPRWTPLGEQRKTRSDTGKRTKLSTNPNLNKLGFCSVKGSSPRLAKLSQK